MHHAEILICHFREMVGNWPAVILHSANVVIWCAVHLNGTNLGLGVAQFTPRCVIWARD